MFKTSTKREKRKTIAYSIGFIILWYMEFIQHDQLNYRKRLSNQQ